MNALSSIQNSLKPGRWVNSTCKMCLHSCSIRVHVTDDGVINKIEGNPTNPSNAGKLCPKGNAGIMRHYDPQRFKQPLRRTNTQKGPGIDPKWEPITWEEAFEITAREIKRSFDADPRRIMPSIEDFQKRSVMVWALALGNDNCYRSGGTMCGGAYHPLNGYIHSTFGAVNDAKYCNYWIANGGGDGFSSHLHAAAQSHWVAESTRRARNEGDLRGAAHVDRRRQGGGMDSDPPGYGPAVRNEHEPCPGLRRTLRLRLPAQGHQRALSRRSRPVLRA